MHISLWFLVPMAILDLLFLWGFVVYLKQRANPDIVFSGLCECRVCRNYEAFILSTRNGFEDLPCVKCESEACNLIEGPVAIEIG